jgi:hypothetical protein
MPHVIAWDRSLSAWHLFVCPEKLGIAAAALIAQQAESSPNCVTVHDRSRISSRHILILVSGASRCWYAAMQAEEQNCM